MAAMEEITDGMDVDIVELGTERSSKRRNVGKEEGGRKIAAESPFSKSKTSKLSEPTLKAIKESEDGAFQPRMEGVHIDEWALTCSREPLASLIQVVELLYHNHFRPCDGTGIIVISAGIDHALETYAVAKELLKYHSLTLGLVVGGTRLAKHARKAANLTIATPWRLLNVLRNSKGFIYENLKCLMIDVTDSSRFGMDEEIINQIKEILPKTIVTRQATLFPYFQHAKATLQHGYCTVPSAKRFLRLYTFLKRNHLEKVVVVFSSCNSVKFHSELLQRLHKKCFIIHEEEELQSQKSTLSDFYRALTGILLCTNVAAHDLRLPFVDWIVQYDPPDEPKNYVDKAGRTAHFLGANTLLFLTPEELPFLPLFQVAKVPIKKFICPRMKQENMQKHLEKEVADNYSLHKSAEDAYRSYLSAYNSHSMKGIFNSDRLNLQGVSASFGLCTTPMTIIHSQQQAHVPDEICLMLKDFSISHSSKVFRWKVEDNTTTTITKEGDLIQDEDLIES